MNEIYIRSSVDVPRWATQLAPALEALRAHVPGLGPVEATSSSRDSWEVVAWAVAATLESGEVLAIGVCRSRHKTPVAIVSRATPLEAMAIVRSLVHRSARRLAVGRRVGAWFGDLVDVPFESKSPQYLIVSASELGISETKLRFAVGCTWAEMALDPSLRADAVRARLHLAKLSLNVMEPAAQAVLGICRALRRAKEPSLSNAAWALQSLLAKEPALGRTALRDLVLDDSLGQSRREMLETLLLQ